MAKGKNRKQRPNPQTNLSQSTPNNQIDRSKQALEESEKELDKLMDELRTKYLKPEAPLIGEEEWRRGRDLNSRYGITHIAV